MCCNGHDTICLASLFILVVMDMIYSCSVLNDCAVMDMIPYALHHFLFWL